VFLMSPPRRDWGLRGRANAFAAGVVDAAVVDRVQADIDANRGAAARAEWLLVARAVDEAGGVVVVVDNDGPDGDATLTGLPYTAEAGLAGVDPNDGTGVFVLPRLTPPHRAREPVVVAPVVRRLGLRPVTLPDDVRCEGQGDVIRIGHDDDDDDNVRFVGTAGVGRWARSDDRAVAHYRRFLPGPTLALGFRADPWFHGNTFLGSWAHQGNVVVVVADEALLGDGPATLRAFVDGARIVVISADETLSYATNALQVGGTVLAPAAVRGRAVPGRVVDVWRGLGLQVRFLELPTLFGRGGGAAVCLTNRLDGVVADRIPEDLLLAAWRRRTESR
jgi:N-dimethylarginine dimethylaminohydrolase